MSQDIDWKRLRDAAERVMQAAHAPYSGFHVGAALLSADGQIFVGCNVENASYGLTICAERNAVFAAVAAGQKQFRALAVIAKGQEPVTPCGACRQVLAEFSPSFEVHCYCDGAQELHETTASLLPHAFSKKSLG